MTTQKGRHEAALLPCSPASF